MRQRQPERCHPEADCDGRLPFLFPFKVAPHPGPREGRGRRRGADVDGHCTSLGKAITRQVMVRGRQMRPPSGYHSKRHPVWLQGWPDGQRCYIADLGVRTASITWMTPFDWITSGMVTLATVPFSSVTVILPSTSLRVSLQPPTVSTTCSPPSAATMPAMSVERALAGITWQARMVASMSLFSGLSRVSTVPAGSASKAALTGARTVKGPAPDRVSTRPAALTAATSVVWSAEFTAFSMMFLSANMAAPPTIGLSWAKAAPDRAVTESMAARVRARKFIWIVLPVFRSPCSAGTCEETGQDGQSFRIF